MTHRTCTFVLLGVLALTNVCAADAVPDQYQERMKEAIRIRIERANETTTSRLAKSASYEPHTFLVSLTERITLGALADAMKRCGCELAQLQRTIGETQVAFAATSSMLANDEFNKRLADEMKEYLQSRMTDLETEINGPAEDKDDIRWSGQKRAAFSKALAQLRAEGVLVNGFLVRGSSGSVAQLRSHFGLRILAVEIVEGTARPFVIPLEVYQ